MILIDNNLSPKLAGHLRDVFPGIVHVQHFGLEAADDFEVWAYAAANNLHIITKDKDFNSLLMLKGFPPKVIRLDCGNATTKQIAALILQERFDILDFFENPQYGLLVIQ